MSLHTFVKGENDWHIPLNENFNGVLNKANYGGSDASTVKNADKLGGVAAANYAQKNTSTPVLSVLETSGFDEGNIWYFKNSGGTVFLFSTGLIAATRPSGIIATLPVGFRPAVNTVVPANQYNGSGGVAFATLITIGSQGAISLPTGAPSSWSSTGVFGFSIPFPTAAS